MKKKNPNQNTVSYTHTHRHTHAHADTTSFPQFMRFCLLGNPLWIVNAKKKIKEKWGSKLEHKRKKKF